MKRVARTTGGDLILKLQQDVTDLRQQFDQFEAKTEAAFEMLRTAFRDGFSGVGKSINRFATHLDAHAESLGELSAKVNEHEQRLNALEAKLP